MAGEQRIVVLGPRAGLPDDENLKAGRLADVRECLVQVLTDDGIEVVDSPADSGPEFAAAVTEASQRGTVVPLPDGALGDAYLIAGIDRHDYESAPEPSFDGGFSDESEESADS